MRRPWQRRSLLWPGPPPPARQPWALPWRRISMEKLFPPTPCRFTGGWTSAPPRPAWPSGRASPTICWMWRSPGRITPWPAMWSRRRPAAGTFSAGESCPSWWAAQGFISTRWSPAGTLPPWTATRACGRPSRPSMTPWAAKPCTGAYRRSTRSGPPSCTPGTSGGSSGRWRSTGSPA